MALTGKNEALSKLNSELRKVKGRNVKGMRVAAAIIKTNSQARTPVDTGNLRASHYIAFGGSKGSPIAEVGLTANYAVKVHEDLAASHPTGQAKFLSEAISSSHRVILDEVRKRVRV